MRFSGSINRPKNSDHSGKHSSVGSRPHSFDHLKLRAFRVERSGRDCLSSPSLNQNSPDWIVLAIQFEELAHDLSEVHSKNLALNGGDAAENWREAGTLALSSPIENS
jgi:hypothetical protein